LKENEFSAFHRLQSDEIWYYHAGEACEIHLIMPDGENRHWLLGPYISDHQHLQIIVPRGCWFAAHPQIGKTYTMVGCAMAPGFSFEDFELASYGDLISTYPEHRELIRMYTRG
jgi:predicted cupin superfamily sugar epimerase